MTPELQHLIAWHQAMADESKRNQAKRAKHLETVAALCQAEASRVDAERLRIKLAGDVEPFAVDQLLCRMVMNAASRHRPSASAFWVRIRELTALGSNCSAGLARWAGFDPETGDRLTNAVKTKG